MGFELTITSASILGFILGGAYSILHRRVINERNRILPKVREKFHKLIEKYRKHPENEVKNFIKDLLGLYVFEIRLKQVEIDFRNLFIGFIGLLLTAFIYDIFGISSLIFVLLLLEIAGIWSYLSFSNIWTANKLIDKYKEGALPREWIKSVKIRAE